MTPFEFPKEFYKQGKSVSNSQRWQCKVCKKKTNVLPKQRQAYSYHQQRNDILQMFARCLLSRVPVKRTCEILGIGSETYYSKLEWLYRQCLKFLERHEQKSFQDRQFERMWIDTDQLLYHMNNIKKRGQGGGDFQDAEDPLFPTYVMVSGDVFSKYIFRSDVAYDWQTTLDDIQLQTVTYKEDHLPEFARKYGGLRFSVAPQPPTPIEDNEDARWEYINVKHDFYLRRKYIDGLHVTQSYTMFYYWLTKQMVHANKWRLVTDADNGLMSAAYRVLTGQYGLPWIRRRLGMDTTNASGKVPIRGWLIVLAIIFWITPIGSSFALIIALLGHKLSSLEPLLITGTAIISIIVLVLFVGRKRTFIQWCLALSGWSIISAVVSTLTHYTSISSMAYSIIGDTVIALYVLRSKRVKNTFIR